MHPYLTDPDKAPALNRAMGSDAWREVHPLRGHARTERFKSLYIKALKETARASYVYAFEIRDKDRKLLHWFFFCTNNLKGLGVMKKAMWKVDPFGRFQFSEHDLGQGDLFAYTQQNLADDLHQVLVGTTLTRHALEEHVLVNTPHYIFGDSIKILRSDKRLVVSGSGDDTTYRFVKRPPVETQCDLF